MPSNAMTHVQYLSTSIGPRGSTTPQERRAAEYARQHFESLGLSPEWEAFRAPVSGWRPFALASIIALISVALFWAGIRITALLAGFLMAITTVSIFQEMYFRPNLLRLLVPKGPSQNVWARILSTNTAARRVLLAGHLDTHRTPWVFTSPGRLSFFRLMTTLGVVAFIFSTVLYFLSVFIDLGWARWLALAPLPIFLVLLALTWQPDTTPYTHGANDNASGAAIVLSLAEQLVRSPLKQTEVWALCSGCEEVGSHGIQAFVERHRDDLSGLMGISIDNVGGEGAGVCYTRVEGMVVPVRPSPELLRLADQIASARLDLGAYSLPFTILHTDATCLMVNKVPSLSFVGLTPGGVIPNWHQVTDTFENVDARPIEDTEAFVMELLRQLDAG